MHPAGLQPEAIDVKRDRGITIQWHDGSSSYFSVAYLRRNSPSADQRQLREELARNPLTVLPSGASGVVTIKDVEMVGTYALRIIFSDGHDTGIYSWAYLREIDPAVADASPRSGDAPKDV